MHWKLKSHTHVLSILFSLARLNFIRFFFSFNWIFCPKHFTALFINEKRAENSTDILSHFLCFHVVQSGRIFNKNENNAAKEMNFLSIYEFSETKTIWHEKITPTLKLSFFDGSFLMKLKLKLRVFFWKFKIKFLVDVTWETWRRCLEYFSWMNFRKAIYSNECHSRVKNRRLEINLMSQFRQEKKPWISLKKNSHANNKNTAN